MSRTVTVTMLLNPVKKQICHLFKFLGLVLLCSFQEVQQYDVTQHCPLDDKKDEL